MKKLISFILITIFALNIFSCALATSDIEDSLLAPFAGYWCSKNSAGVVSEGLLIGVSNDEYCALFSRFSKAGNNGIQSSVYKFISDPNDDNIAYIMNDSRIFKLTLNGDKLTVEELDVRLHITEEFERVK